MLREYKSRHNKNLMKHEGDVVLARENYYKYKPRNLVYLLNKRFSWMNKYIKEKDKVLEVGCGTGVSKDFIREDCSLLLTDFADHPWVEKKVDALKTRLKKNNYDVVFCSNMIHHTPYPKKFFTEMNRILKPGGYLLIQEVNCSIAMRLILRIMKHEGWSYNADVYSLKIPCTDKDDLWSANCAIPNLLFDDLEKFNKEVPYFDIVEKSFSEFFIFPLSGGVIAKAKTIELPLTLLRLIGTLDSVLVFLSPRFFALQRRIVLIKKA
ncbi:MAG: class I SAM-dependent methyltransferase [Nanoarchaeota archaeon]|nr:class I SAM-dependent methyltransferase [Nanoarchaeota archaeon]